MSNLTDFELKEIYKADYVRNYHQVDSGRISNVLSNIAFNRDEIVADFGCGNGLLAEFLCSKIKEYHGIDFSELFIKAAQDRNSGANNLFFYCCDIVKFCEDKNEFFDKIFAIDFSEHIYDKDFVEIFKTAYNSLKPDGKLVLHTPNGNYILEILKNKHIMRQVTGHIAVRNFKQYQILLKQSGFENIQVEFLGHYQKLMKKFNWLSRLPIIGYLFQARLLITANKSLIK